MNIVHSGGDICIGRARIDLVEAADLLALFGEELKSHVANEDWRGREETTGAIVDLLSAMTGALRWMMASRGMRL